MIDFLEDGNLIMKVGEGHLRIEEFIQLFTYEELEKMKNGGRRSTPKGRKTELDLGKQG